MSAPNLKKSRLLLFLSALILVCAGGALLIFSVVSARSRERDETLYSLLGDVDAAMDGGQYERAELLLPRAFDLAKRGTPRMSVMKRVYRLCRARGDYAQLVVWADEARSRDAANPALIRLAVLARLRAGRPEAALEILTKRMSRRLIRTDAGLQTLAAEAALLVPQAGDKVWLPPELRAVISLDRGVHPSLLIEQGRVSGDQRYFLDAALLWMRRGQAANAQALLKSRLGNVRHEPAAYIAYDAGAYEEAARRAAFLIVERPENADYRRFSGDLLYLLGRYDEARTMYLRALQLEPDADWQLMLSLAAALERNGDREGASFYTARAYEEFPGVREVLVRYALDLAGAGQTERAAGIIRGVLAESPRDAELQYLYLRLSGSPRSGRELWKLFNRFPEHPGLARELVGYLLSSADLRGAGLAINQHLSAAPGDGSAPWLLEARALLAALSGDLARAESLLLKKAGVEDSWQGRYNLAVVMGAEARYSEGIGELMTAESLVPGNGAGSDIVRSKIRSRLGEFYAALGDALSARRELGYALELDPANLRARLMMKKLDEVGEK